jgi:hypothetical protein
MVDLHSLSQEFPELPSAFPPLENAIQKAYQEIPFFRQFYSKAYRVAHLKDFQKVPLTDRCILAQAESLHSLLKDPQKIFGTVYSFNQNHRTFPFQVVESAEEIKSRHERISFCIRKGSGIDLGNQEHSKQERFLILYNQAQAFFSSDLASEIGWECYQNALVLIDPFHSEKEIYEKISAFQPDVLFISASFPHFKPSWIPSCVRTVFTFRHNQPALENASSFDCCDIYTLDEFPYVGVKLPHETFYRYNPWLLYIEKTTQGRLALTSFNWENWAWIRYTTYDHLQTADEFTFEVRFLGHW